MPDSIAIISLSQYCAVFIVSIYFAKIYENSVHAGSRSNIEHILSFVLVVAPVSLMFGLRSYDVGYDTVEHYWSYFQYYKYASFSDLLQMGREPLYALLTYACYNIFHNYTVNLLVISFLTNGIFFYAVTRFRQRISIPLAWFVYLFYFALLTEDQSRNMLGISIVMVSLQYVVHKRPVAFVITVAIATLVHFSMACGVLLYLANLESKHGSRSHVSITVPLMIMILACVFIQLIYNLLGSVVTSFDSKYSRYFGEYATLETTSNTGLGFLLVMIPNLFPVLIFRKQLSSNMDRLFLFAALLSCPLRMLGYESLFLSRLSYLPSAVMVLTYGSMYTRCLNSKHRSVFLYATVVLFVFCYIYMYTNTHGVVPYEIIFAED